MGAGLITHYRSQNGRLTPIREMHDQHLKNAIAAIERQGRPLTDPGLAALHAERKRREVQGG